VVHDDTIALNEGSSLFAVLPALNSQHFSHQWMIGDLFEDIEIISEGMPCKDIIKADKTFSLIIILNGTLCDHKYLA
jgi:hypothetical protein